MKKVIGFLKSLYGEFKELKRQYEIYFFINKFNSRTYCYSPRKRVFVFPVVKDVLFLLFVVFSIFVLEPFLRENLPFTFKLSAQTATGSSTFILAQQANFGPEPITFLLFLGGIVTIIVRFVRRFFAKFKRYFDLVLSIFGLTISLPILSLAAILIKLNSRGPILYKQERVGEKGEVFKIYKLRTMEVDAEKETGAIWAKKNDPRITTVGKILRKTHIDEIPQLFNVVKGEMSIIGPRPERPEMVRNLKHVILDYDKRLQVKPGITGFAQAWHKYDETLQDVKKKVKYDLLYVKRMGLWVDLRIMAQTLAVVVTGRGAN